NEDREAWLARLLPYSDREITTAPIPHTYEGPMSRVIGLLEASLGRYDAADTRLESAQAKCRGMRLAPWVARLSLERGRVLRAAGRAREAQALFEEAVAIAGDLGMRGIESMARVAAGEGSRIARPAPPPVPAPGPRASIRIEREGEVWRVDWAGQVVRVRDSRGLQLLAKLVHAHGERIHALALGADGDAALPESSAGDAIDTKAVGAYRARLASIDEDIASAEATADDRRAARLLRERELLVAEIARSVGLGGRLRKVGSATERARIAVTRRLRDAIARIGEANAQLGQHLRTEVRTGTYCSYGEKS
ncbi:MAG: tetratricopeptide repeat protein, partial [Polyangiaceae bacterium]